MKTSDVIIEYSKAEGRSWRTASHRSKGGELWLQYLSTRRLMMRELQAA